jgi:CRP-like cAMP-binding protein
MRSKASELFCDAQCVIAHMRDKLCVSCETRTGFLVAPTVRARVKISVRVSSILVDPRENRLLAGLPHEEFERLQPSLQQTAFSLGDVLYEFGGRLNYVYFPTTAIVSLLYTMENGATAEMGLTGNDGVVGIALFMGGETMPNRAVIQSAGNAVRMKVKVLQEEFAMGGQFQRLLLRYTQALITQISQTAVCNRLHSVEQQLCRWLLLSHDRVSTDELIMTQELIADMLGVRREGVTVAAGHLQDIGAISYVRGRIQILDRQKLEDTACECYRVVKDEFDRLLGYDSH